MQLEALYSATFTTPERWSVELPGSGAAEAQAFLVAEGRVSGRLAGRLRGANWPRRRSDGVLLPDFRGVVETDDGATVLFSWQGYTRTGSGGDRELVGSITHISADERYRWLNTVIGVLCGGVRPRAGGNGFDVVFDVAEVVWEAPADSGSGG